MEFVAFPVCAGGASRDSDLLATEEDEAPDEAVQAFPFVIQLTSTVIECEQVLLCDLPNALRETHVLGSAPRPGERPYASLRDDTLREAQPYASRMNRFMSAGSRAARVYIGCFDECINHVVLDF